MSNALTGLLFGLGFGAWMYSVMMRQTGSQMQASLIVAALAGVIGFFVVFSLLGLLFGQN